MEAYEIILEKQEMRNRGEKSLFLVLDYSLSENAQTKVIFVVHKIDVDK